MSLEGVMLRMGLTSNKERKLRIFWQKLRRLSRVSQAESKAAGGFFQ